MSSTIYTILHNIIKTYPGIYIDTLCNGEMIWSRNFVFVFLRNFYRDNEHVRQLNCNILWLNSSFVAQFPIFTPNRSQYKKSIQNFFLEKYFQINLNENCVFFLNSFFCRFNEMGARSIVWCASSTEENSKLNVAHSRSHRSFYIDGRWCRRHRLDTHTHRVFVNSTRWMDGRNGWMDGWDGWMRTIWDVIHYRNTDKTELYHAEKYTFRLSNHLTFLQNVVQFHLRTCVCVGMCPTSRKENYVFVCVCINECNNRTHYHLCYLLLSSSTGHWVIGVCMCVWCNETRNERVKGVEIHWHCHWLPFGIGKACHSNAITMNNYYKNWFILFYLPTHRKSICRSLVGWIRI